MARGRMSKAKEAMERAAQHDPQMRAAMQQQAAAATGARSQKKQYDSSKIDVKTLRAKKSQTIKLVPFYSAVLIVPSVLLLAAGKFSTTSFTMVLWGVVAWYSALTLRLPFQSLSSRVPGLDHHTVMSFGVGLMDAFIKYVVLFYYPGAATLGRAFSLGMGWSVLEAVAGFFSLYATVALADRTDPQAMDAKARMKEINMPDPITVVPLYSYFEHMSECLFTLSGSLLVYMGNGSLLSVILIGGLHAAVLFVARVALKTAKIGPIFLLASSIVAFFAAIILSGFFGPVPAPGTFDSAAEEPQA
ncbi:hypothetical protein HDU97_010305 [Phlyctochytrium planicorne]|nr:hypothetical protein HDU97_010305 [Phlyctochytrium planicorne]